MKGSLHPLDWAVILAYVVTLVGLGFYHTRRRPAPAEEFVLAGRRVTLPAFVMTLVATWYGGILGVGENTFLYGVSNLVYFRGAVTIYSLSCSPPHWRQEYAPPSNFPSRTISVSTTALHPAW